MHADTNQRNQTRRTFLVGLATFAGSALGVTIYGRWPRKSRQPTADLETTTTQPTQTTYPTNTSSDLTSYEFPKEPSNGPQTPKKPTPQPEQNPKKETSEYVISNEFFRNSEYLTTNQITRLLEKKRSCLRGKGIETAITNLATEHNINPLLILARLQVEKSLIYKKTATAKELQYATGFGARDEEGWLPSSGISAQLRFTAKTLDKFYNEFKGKPLKVDYGKLSITPENAASEAIWRYTPHRSGFRLNNIVMKQIDREIRTL